MLDLHTHTTASDGSMAPAALVALADRIGLAGLAPTDHDTVAGLPEALAAAADASLELVPGVELSATADRGAIHIVGLYVDHTEPGLLAGLGRVRRWRDERNPGIAQKLTELGKPVELEEVIRIADGGVVGRPHFAAAMVARGHVRNADEAFARYLSSGGAAYVPKRKLAPAECIGLIRGAGGVPVLAHPDQALLDRAELRGLVGRLADQGLVGLEVYCPSYDSSMTRHYREIALEYGLVESGGTDFHGDIKPGIKLGRGFGSLYVPDSLLEPIAEAAAGIRKGNR